jgi:predicted RNase H-like HicB family nuclease
MGVGVPDGYLPRNIQSLRFKIVNEIVFEVTQDADGGFCAECLTESIFTQGDTWDELRTNVKEAVEAFYFDRPRPAGIRLHLIRDEVLALG